MPNFSATSGASSTSSLATFTRPAYSPARASMAGAIIRQGGHQVAQKSTSTGSIERSTSASKLALVRCKTLSLTGLSFSLDPCEDPVRLDGADGPAVTTSIPASPGPNEERVGRLTDRFKSNRSLGRAFGLANDPG